MQRWIAFLLLVLAAGRSTAYPFTILDSTRAPAGTKAIVLTFDDGPSPGVTDGILRVLARHNVRATFFVMGVRAQTHPDLVRRIHADGHDIGLHGWTGDWPVLFDIELLRADIARTTLAIERATGARLPKPPLYRPQRGITAWAYDSLLESCEIRPGYLTFYAFDAGVGPDDADALMARLQASLLDHNGGAIVLHTSRYRANPDDDDRIDKFWLADALDTFIPWARQQGFRFVQYSEYRNRNCSPSP